MRCKQERMIRDDESRPLFLLMPYRKPRVYSGLNAKVLEQHCSTPTSVVKPKVCILNRTPGLPGDIYGLGGVEFLKKAIKLGDFLF